MLYKIRQRGWTICVVVIIMAIPLILFPIPTIVIFGGLFVAWLLDRSRLAKRGK